MPYKRVICDEPSYHWSTSKWSSGTDLTGWWGSSDLCRPFHHRAIQVRKCMATRSGHNGLGSLPRGADRAMGVAPSLCPPGTSVCWSDVRRRSIHTLVPVDHAAIYYAAAERGSKSKWYVEWLVLPAGSFFSCKIPHLSFMISTLLPEGVTTINAIFRISWSLIGNAIYSFETWYRAVTVKCVFCHNQ